MLSADMVVDRLSSTVVCLVRSDSNIFCHCTFFGLKWCARGHTVLFCGCGSIIACMDLLLPSCLQKSCEIEIPQNESMTL